jgi:hypothetical protein
MESINVYKTVPHPGIQENLNSYYSKQVCAVSRESPRSAGDRHELTDADSPCASTISS